MFLSIPELVPFRLTQQLRGVLRPLGTDALLVPSMNATLSALHAQRDVLLRTVQIFVRDPVTEWTSNAKRFLEAGAGAMRNILDEQQQPQLADKKAKSDVAALANRARVDNVRFKLELGDPVAAVMRDVECAWPTKNKEVYRGIKAILRAAQHSDCRACVAADGKARLDACCADVQQQVRCLIALATSPEVLSHTYIGWSSFI
jgi:DNA-dependent protein kinase catalytic subunit